MLTLFLPLWAIILLIFFVVDMLLLFFIKELWHASKRIHSLYIILEIALSALYLIDFSTAWKVVFTIFCGFIVWICIEMENAPQEPEEDDNINWGEVRP